MTPAVLLIMVDFVGGNEWAGIRVGGGGTWSIFSDTLLRVVCDNEKGTGVYNRQPSTCPPSHWTNFIFDTLPIHVLRLTEWTNGMRWLSKQRSVRRVVFDCAGHVPSLPLPLLDSDDEQSFFVTGSVRVLRRLLRNSVCHGTVCFTWADVCTVTGLVAVWHGICLCFKAERGRVYGKKPTATPGEFCVTLCFKRVHLRNTPMLGLGVEAVGNTYDACGEPCIRYVCNYDQWGGSWDAWWRFCEAYIECKYRIPEISVDLAGDMYSKQSTGMNQ